MYLLRKRCGAGTGDQAADDVGEADQRERPARHRRRQSAEIHLARQVRHQERDVKSAGEKADVQQQVAAVAHRVADGVPRRRLAPAAWCVRRRADGLTTRARGRAPSVITASDHIAPIQPSAWISACDIGANTNCPNDPPALMMPAALPRLSGGECAARRRRSAPRSCRRPSRSRTAGPAKR